MKESKIEKIIRKVENAYNLKESDNLENLIDNDGWQSEIEEEVLEELAKASDISKDKLIEIIEEYRHNNKDNSNNENKENIKKKKSGSNSAKYVILGGGALILIGVGYFLYQIATTYKKGDNRKSIKTVSQKKDTNQKVNHLKVDSVKFETVKDTKTDTKHLAKKETQKDDILDNSKKMVEKEKDIPIKEKKEVKTAQCFTKGKYINKEVVYYVFNAKLDKYVPVFERADWDKRGYKLPDKIISEDLDDNKNMLEVEKGKWLPLKLFSKCSFIK